MAQYSTLPGFRDFYPADFAVRAHIMRAWRETAQRYGFEEYDGPPLESLELYTDKSGEEIVRQLYNFEDKGGRAVTLRPEMTPTLARMVGARAGGLRKPIRWFAVPQLFRYERTQRGRLREHFQWNIDILGGDDVTSDAEVLGVALDALRSLGLGADDIVARFNDRRLLRVLLTSVGVPEERLVAAYGVVDKLAREPEERIRQRLTDEAGLATQVIDELLDVFRVDGIAALRERCIGRDEVLQEIERLQQFEHTMRDLGFGDFIRFDLTIVRGLAYYTGTVFEVFDRRGELRAICGGGRYDRLLANVSGADLPGVGFGMGDVVLTELLRDRELLPSVEPHVDVFLVLMRDEDRPLLLRTAQVLRAAGRSVLFSLRTGGVGKQLKEADARGADIVILFGPDEVARGAATVRSMKGGGQREVSLDALLADPAAVLA
jgi:histidyl-tRNA synthetase